MDEWLRQVLWESTLPLSNNVGSPKEAVFEIHRLKGRLLLQSGLVKMVQGVREIFEITDLSTEGTTEGEGLETGKIVLIGRNVADQGWEESLMLCLKGIE